MTHWSNPLTESLHAQFLISGVKSHFCPQAIRRHLGALRFTPDELASQIVLESALLSARRADGSMDGAAFDRALTPWMHRVLSIHARGINQIGRFSNLWNCLSQGYDDWESSQRGSSSVWLNDITLEQHANHQLPNLFTPIWGKGAPPSASLYRPRPDYSKEVTKRAVEGVIGCELVDSPIDQRYYGRRALHGALGAPILTRAIKYSESNPNIIEVVQRVAAFLGPDLVHPQTDAPWLRELVTNALNAFDHAAPPQTAIFEVYKHLTSDLSLLNLIRVVGHTNEGKEFTWSPTKEGMASWLLRLNIKQIDVYEPMENQMRKDFLNLSLAAHFLTRRDLASFGLPMPGLTTATNILEDPLWQL